MPSFEGGGLFEGLGKGWRKVHWWHIGFPGMGRRRNIRLWCHLLVTGFRRGWVWGLTSGVVKGGAEE